MEPTTNIDGFSSSSSCPASDEVSSDNYEFKKPVSKRIASGKCPGTKQILPEWVSSWNRRTVEKHLNIYYERNYLDSPLDVLEKVGDIPTLSEEQKIYLSTVNSYLHFDAEIKKYDPPYEFYSKDLKPVFDDILKKVMTTPEKEDITSMFARIKVHRFIKELRRLLEVIEEKKKRYEVNYEANYSRLIGAFAEMSCLEAVVCTTADQTVWKVWKNLKCLQVTSKPDFRFYKCGILDSASDVVVSVIEVKRDLNESCEQTKRKKELTEPSKKKIKIGSTSSSSSTSSTSTSSRKKSIHSNRDKPQLELDLNKRVLGQHAGELLLDLDRYRVPNEKLADLSNKLTMPGMVVDGTKVYFTLLEMTVQHHTRLHYNLDLDSEDKAVVYYSKALDILKENDRKILLENFVRLNNVP